MSDYPDSGIYHFFLVQGQRSQRKSVAHQDEHSFSVRSTVSISITDFGKVDPKFSEQWYFLGLRLPCFPLPFPYLGPELQHSRTEARKLSIHCSVSFLQQKFVGPSIFPKDNYSKPRSSQDRKTAPGVRKYGTFTCFPKQELFFSLPTNLKCARWLTFYAWLSYMSMPCVNSVSQEGTGIINILRTRRLICATDDWRVEAQRRHFSNGWNIFLLQKNFEPHCLTLLKKHRQRATG